MNQTESLPTNGQHPLTVSQRALVAARLVQKFSPDARERQRAGAPAPDGNRGKSAAKAAAQCGVSTRAVELANTVLKWGVPELVRAVEYGKLGLSPAAKLASQKADLQREAAAAIAAGRPIAETLAAAGVRNREPLSFDDKTLTQALAQVRKLLDLRARAFGPCDAYRQTAQQLELAGKALRRWRTERLDEPVPVIVDACGRRVPIKLVPAFQMAEEIKLLCGQIVAIVRQVEALTRQRGGDLIQTHCVLPHLTKAREVLGDAQAVEVCSLCWGAVPRCASCRGRGWLPVRTWTPATP